jgi:hypothetical protein
MHSRIILVLSAIVISVIVACLTDNVYFYPSEEVDQTPTQIIDEIRGAALPDNEQGEPQGMKGGEETELEWWHLAAVAYG